MCVCVCVCVCLMIVVIRWHETFDRTFRFQSKVLAGFLLHHFPLCVPPSLPHSPFLSLSLCASPFVPVLLFLCFCFSPRN